MAEENDAGDGGESEATCPLCGDYTGPPESVESHISAMTDEAHQGEAGVVHREAIRESVDGEIAEVGGADGADQDDADDADQDGADVGGPEAAGVPVEVGYAVGALLVLWVLWNLVKSGAEEAVETAEEAQHQDQQPAAGEDPPLVEG